MNKYRFLIAWMHESDGACGEETGIHTSNDLIPEFEKGNEHVTCWEIVAPNIEQAYNIGYRKCFFENWTANDSLTVCYEVEEE